MRVYVDEKKRTKKTMSSFSFGSGTLQGHLLVGTFFFFLAENLSDSINTEEVKYKDEEEGATHEVKRLRLN